MNIYIVYEYIYIYCTMVYCNGLYQQLKMTWVCLNIGNVVNIMP